LNKSRIDTLARLMATEDISVVHDAGASTASFSMDSRTLTLPVWEAMSDSLYDMLVGHEVAHALWTPFENRKQFMSDIEYVGSNFDVAKDFINIVEDARIERNIKAKYPGLKRDFVAGYGEMIERDLFGLDGRKANDLDFIDRLNIHFKCGALAGVEFSAEEMAFVDAVAKCDTWQDVLDVAKSLYEYLTPKAKKQEDGEGEDVASNQDMDDMEDADGEGMDTEAGDDQSDEDSNGESNSGDTDGDEDGEENDAEGTSGQGDDEGDDAGGHGTQAGSGNDTTTGPAAPETQRAMDKNLEEMVDGNAPAWHYGQIPSFNIENGMRTVAQLKEMYEEVLNSKESQGYLPTPVELDAMRGDFESFRRESGKMVGQMAQWFEMKKRADEDRNTMTSLTGEIDLERLVDYKFNDDIFLRNETTPEGQNHGIIITLDWSGSMSGMMEETCKQALQLIWFCERVNIPCELYAFTSVIFETGEAWGRAWEEKSIEVKDRWNLNENTLEPDDHLTMLQWYDSSIKGKDRLEQLVRLFHICRWCDGNIRFGYNRTLGLGGTPLTESMMAMDTMIPDFRRRTGAQIVNLCVLSDGEGSPGCMNKVGTQRSWDDNVVIEDPVSRRRVQYHGRKDGDGASTIAEMLKIRHDVNCIGFYIAGGKATRVPYFRNLNQWDDKIVQEWKKNKCVFFPHGGFDEYFIIKSQQVETDALDGLDEDASFTKIKNSFVKGAKSLKTSRMVLGRVIDLVA
jgi:hypothetical protein